MTAVRTAGRAIRPASASPIGPITLMPSPTRAEPGIGDRRRGRRRRHQDPGDAQARGDADDAGLRQAGGERLPREPADPP